ncbi:hypothetical protein MAPG_08253 [Magnaporthiopsis poae ATCC 64411]|uniref:Uncharacterized protein n=1 Tax=Magnaporthiopsis poae (strain ATCC 64411 / 73-15) TaxID=644358 RepID=A0A0C4E6V6_MAGP6|nr:hypothetical protein MAPG_08253 [Magnaporthiopsis poae ATCC 64411]
MNAPFFFFLCRRGAAHGRARFLLPRPSSTLVAHSQSNFGSLIFRTCPFGLAVFLPFFIFSSFFPRSSFSPYHLLGSLTIPCLPLYLHHGTCFTTFSFFIFFSSHNHTPYPAGFLLLPGLELFMSRVDFVFLLYGRASTHPMHL